MRWPWIAAMKKAAKWETMTRMCHSATQCLNSEAIYSGNQANAAKIFSYWFGHLSQGWQEFKLQFIKSKQLEFCTLRVQSEFLKHLVGRDYSLTDIRFNICGTFVNCKLMLGSSGECHWMESYIWGMGSAVLYVKPALMMFDFKDQSGGKVDRSACLSSVLPSNLDPFEHF